MFEVILDTLIDSLRLLPFLFITYLVMEYIEHKTSSKAGVWIQKAGKFGPIAGGLLGVFPQCGFSAAASNFYAGRMITMGTLIAVFLSTSDEMLPIMISDAAAPSVIIRILLIKIGIGILAGFCIDTIWRKEADNKKIHALCEQEHCHCEKGILKSAISHTLQIFFFLVIVSFFLNTIIFFLGEDMLASMLLNRPIAGHLLAGIVGLIPNCAASVLITQLYLEGAVSFGAMMSGLLVGAGIGILVLWRVNHDKKENLKIIGLLYVIGVASGIVIDVLQSAF